MFNLALLAFYRLIPCTATRYFYISYRDGVLYSHLDHCANYNLVPACIVERYRSLHPLIRK